MILSISPKTKKLLKALFIIAVILLVAGLIFSYFRGNVVPVFTTTCEAEVKALAINAANRATNSVLFNESMNYNDLFEVVKNNDGDVTLIEAKSININKFAREIAILTQRYLENNGTTKISIPLGTLSGITMFVGTGPDVNIEILPIAATNCDFYSEFQSAGINQTIHKIYVIVLLSVTVALPASEISVETQSEILVCENLIVGKVPDTYLGVGKISSGYNLVP